MSYTELSIEERVTLQIGRYQALSQREIARLLGRSSSTISSELRKNTDSAGPYVACGAQAITRERRKVCCPPGKLVPAMSCSNGSSTCFGSAYLLSKSQACCAS